MENKTDTQSERVTAFYPDKTIRTFTVQRLRVLYRLQPDEWKQDFFYKLLNYGRVDIGTVEYVLIKNY